MHVLGKRAGVPQTGPQVPSREPAHSQERKEHRMAIQGLPIDARRDWEVDVGNTVTVQITLALRVRELARYQPN